MAAPDLPSLLNFAANWRGAIVTAATAAGLQNVVPDLSTANKTAPYIDLHFVLGDPTGYKMPVTHQYQAYGATLTWGVYTNRDVTTQDHEAMCAQVRAFMATALTTLDASVLPYYQWNKARPMRNVVGIDKERKLDVTQLPFDIHFSIRTEAFPA